MPWGHLAVGYLVYTIGTRVWHRRPPTGEATLVLVFGTQLPDLIDKPLQWYFGLYDGRAIGHSLLVVVPLCLATYLFFRRHDRTDLGVAFAVGVLTHILGDAWRAIYLGDIRGRAPYLLWPIWEPPTYSAQNPGDHLDKWLATVRSINFESPSAFVDTLFSLPVVFSVLFFVLWAVDGFPGVGATRRILARLRNDYVASVRDRSR
ncbi:metal-dependent hydrolase [Natronoglomus mannanivorans]|nr:metal-dependent hydrolase [Halobacteria archaeon AArc-xg1-1]